ncbi:MAG TPA: hypothetical protein VMC08_02670, partial [Bacteroidales bacterium]|nr:hypothetical protein [Bacteroidales bacterium]
MKTKLLLLMTFCLFSVLPAGAQWSNNPLDNTQISYSGDEAAVPYVATHPCGTTYISWFTPGSGGNYYPWMQCLDAAGNFQWSIPGLFISGHPSMTWITDYSMIVCPDTCAVISFQDMRATANDIFIYKISPSGAFLWGPNGVQLSDNPDFEADPVLAAFPDNSVAVAWPRSPNTGDETVIMQRLSNAGVKQWSSDLVLGESGYNYTWPRVVAAENGNTLLVNYKEWGPYYAPNRIILAQKYDPSGNAVWSAPATLFTGATPVYVHPIVAADGLGGAFVCWFYEKVANHLSTFVQHVDAGGNVTMAPNGVEVNTNSSTLHLEPNIGCDTVNHELYVFWRETDLNQNSYGLFGQRVSMDGTLHWGTNAKLFVQLSNKNVTIINVSPMKAGAIVSYFYDDWVTSTQTKVRAIRVDSSGNTVWTGGYRDVSTKQSGKGNLYAGPLANSQVVYAWWDDRLGGQQIFAQNL